MRKSNAQAAETQKGALRTATSTNLLRAKLPCGVTPGVKVAVAGHSATSLAASAGRTAAAESARLLPR